MMSFRSLSRTLAGLGILLLAACGAREPSPTAPSSSSAGAANGPGAALQVTQLKAGTGAVVGVGQKAVVQYTGWLYESGAPDHKGKEFDSSLTSGHPFSFELGAGQVIKGWDQGVLGMHVGESRRLTIPPDLAYGDTGAGGVIPPGATLVFDVELTAIE